jgi:hypothetical protein
MTKHPISNIQHPEKLQTSNAYRAGLVFGAWNFSGAWSLVLGAWLGLGAFAAWGQTPAVPQPDPLMQLMLTQPSIDISTNVEINAVFDPPVIGPGEKSTYRVTINAISDSVRWPDEIYAPSQLTVKRSARGQILQPAADKLRPTTTINHHVTATTNGTFTIPEFRVRVYNQNVTVPAARLQVVPRRDPSMALPLRLFLELAETNAYSGQPISVRVFMPSVGGNILQALQQMQINGDGILVDQTSVRQRIQTMEYQGRSGPVFIYEAMLTPLVSGRVELSAQAFTTGNQFGGAIIIQGNTIIPGGPPQYLLLDSEPVELNVEPLPRAGELPGFSGAIGQFQLDPPQLSTNVVRVGDVVKLLVTFNTTGEVKRLLPPPPPAVTNWQITPAVAVGGPRLTATPTSISTSVSFAYNLIPLTNSVTATPPIPFSYFDPQRGSYVDLTIPAVPLTVQAGDVSATAQAVAQAAAATASGRELKLAALTTTAGRTMATLLPLQLQRGFWMLQLGPLLFFAGLWWWERRRRFYELHPDVLVRRRAKRALRRERKQLHEAIRSGDALRYVRTAVSAFRIGSAPHFPATPRALVGRDVLELLPEAERTSRAGAAVRQCFASVDAADFSSTSPAATELLSLQADVDAVLNQLEAKL